MRPFLLFSLLALTAASHSASAQINLKTGPLSPLTLRYGIRAGGQVTRMTATPPDYSYLPSKLTFFGGQGGVVLDADMGWLSVQPAVVFTQKGYRINKRNTVEDQGVTYQDNTFLRLRLNYLEIPLNVVVNVQGVQLFAGPYLGVGLGGRYRYEIEEPVRSSASSQTYTQRSYENDTKVQFRAGKQALSADDEAFKRLDAGYTVGVGYKAGPLQVQLSHSHGLKNTFASPYSNFNSQAKHRGIQLNLTYFFSPAS